MIDLTTAGGLRGAVASEWTKLWSLRSTWWCLVSGAALLGLSALTLGGGNGQPAQRRGEGSDATGRGVGGISAVTFAQFAFLTVAMLAVTGEYASGGIRVTLQATTGPRSRARGEGAGAGPGDAGGGVCPQRRGGRRLPVPVRSPVRRLRTCHPPRPRSTC